MPDIVVGAPFDSTRGLNAGRAFVWFGGSELTGDPDLIFEAVNGGDYFGFAVSMSMGSVVVGAPRDGDGGAIAGAGYFFELDRDNDGLSNSEELAAGTDPNIAD